MLNTQVIRSHAALGAVSREWAELHRAAKLGSPFGHPAWSGTWARHFVRDGDLRCIAVYKDGDLVGFVPLYLRHLLGVRGGPVSIQPLGTGRNEALTEVVQIVSGPVHVRDVARAVVGVLERDEEPDWFQLSLGPHQGWLVPQWLESRSRSSILHQASRACVVFDALDRDGLFGGLKRNVRESIRRSRNRSARHGDITVCCVEDPSDVSSVLPDLVDLHGRRSRLPGKVVHPHRLSDPRSVSFVAEAVDTLAAAGLARIHVARHRGRTAAALLVLSDGDTDYVALSGMDPEFWELGLPTALLADALSHAADDKKSAVNLSTGPDTDKLRWSSTIVAFNDFVVVSGRSRSRLAHGAYAHLAVVARLRQERLRHRLAGGS